MHPVQSIPEYAMQAKYYFEKKFLVIRPNRDMEVKFTSGVSGLVYIISVYEGCGKFQLSISLGSYVTVFQNELLDSNSLTHNCGPKDLQYEVSVALLKSHITAS